MIFFFVVQMLYSDVYTLSDHRKMKHMSSCLCRTLCLFTRNQRCLNHDLNYKYNVTGQYLCLAQLR